MSIEIQAPKSVTQAAKLLRKKFIPFAGGTTILLTHPKDGKFLDLSQLNLNYIKYQKNFLRIGAITTISELLAEKKLEKFFAGLIPKSLLTIGSTLNRNMITVGGNIVGIHPWSVLPGLLLLLDARIKAASGNIYPAEKLFSRLPKDILKNDLVTEIEIPLTYKSFPGNWTKFSLTTTDYPLVSIGSLQTNKDIRVVTVGLTLLPQLFILNLKNPFEDINAIVQKVKISQDIRISPEYKREILATLIQDTIKTT